MIRAATVEHPARVADAARRMLRVVVLVAAHQRHHAHAGLEAREPQCQPREHQERDPYHHKRVAVVREQRVLPVGRCLRVRRDLVEAYAHDEEVQEQVGPDDERPRCRWPP